MMTTHYRPVITSVTGNLADPDVDKLQDLIDKHQLTHCRDAQGIVWKMHGWLNRKSVALDHAGPPDMPRRLPFPKVESIGRMEDHP